MEKNVYAEKGLLPMTIGGTAGGLDDDDYLYELKFDGYRCLAYLDPQKEATNIQSKRNYSLLDKFPELGELHRLVGDRCVLDGELVIFSDGGYPSFEALQGRGHMRNALAIDAAARATPATLVVFDILYEGDDRLTGLPLWKRKQRLEQAVAVDALPHTLQVSVYAEGDGNAIYAFAQKHGLEGVIAKQRDSVYTPGRRTKEWFKVKLLDDDDFVICGYFDSMKTNVTTLILGQYDVNGNMVDAGHVVLGRPQEDYVTIAAAPKAEKPPFTPRKSDVGAVWLKPWLVCTVTYSYRRPNGSMRHAKYKGLREDKLPEEAVAPQKV